MSGLRISFAVVAVLACFTLTSLQAQAQFTLLRTATIDLGKGRESVDMRQVRGTFSSLRFRMRRGQLSVVKTTIYFGNGQRQVITRRLAVRPRAFTSSLAIRPSTQPIVRILFEYVRTSGPRVILEIHGLRTPPRARPGQVARPRAAPPRRFKLERVPTQRKPSAAAPTVRPPGPAPKSAQQRAREEAIRRIEEARRAAERRRTIELRRRQLAQRQAAQKRKSATAQPKARAQPQQKSRAETVRRTIEARRRAEAQRRAAEQRRRAAAPRPKIAQRRSDSETRPAAPTSGGLPKSTARRGAAPGAEPDCVSRKACTLVRIFFGTNRERDSGAEAALNRVSFGSRRNEADAIADEMTLGRAVVTVPRALIRRPGDIARPGFLEGFWDRYVRGVTPEGDPSRHFVIVKKGFELYSSPDAFIRAVANHRATAGNYKDHAFVFVHGYNTKFDHALFRTAQIAYDLGEPNDGDGVFTPFGTPFMYSWPSAGGELYYPYDQESARFAVAHLKIFLDLIVTRSGAEKIHLIAHSMGNVPLLNALAAVAASPPGNVSIDQVILAAPDMDAAEFRRLAAQVRPLAKGFTMYSSASDAAMDVSRTLHNGLPRAGDVITGRPTIANGVHTIDISEITTCYFCTGHSEYVEQPTLLNDISALLRAGLRLPHERNVTLREQRLAGRGTFWRYRP
ncbi:MAG: alpha/beta hydrolase [Hyphomicrobiaceae bacterium]